MEITNYNGIIIVDNFINDFENETLVSLIDKPSCYETPYYWKHIKDGNLVTPIQLNRNRDGFFTKYIGLSTDANLVLEDIHKKTMLLLKSPRKLKIENCGIEKFSKELPYYADSMIPDKEVDLGTPTSNKNDWSDFKPYSGPWRNSTVATRIYASYIFINDDFQGGSITFPQHNLEVDALRNRMVCFPCNKDYIRGIRPINGSEFLLSTWYQYR